MTDSATPGAWISEYDYPNRRVTLTLADSEAVGHHWTGIRKDQSLSDPGGDFDVYVSHRPERDADLLESHAIVKIVVTLSEDGDIKNPHPDLNTYSIGSPTIWPYKIAGERFGLAHWVWWVTDDVFGRDPRPWAEAIRSDG